jgi:methyl-accepting chemotaxis protein
LKAQLNLLRDNFQYFERFDGEIRRTSEAAFDSWANFNTEFRKTSESFGVMDADLQKFASTIKKRFEGVFGETADKWTNAQKLAVQKSVELFMTGINGYSDMADAQRKEIESKLLAPMYIPIDADTREANRALTEMREYLNELVGEDWVIKLHLETVGSFEQLYDQLDKTVKKSNETIKKLGDGFSEKDKARITSMATDINTLTDKEKEYRDAVLNRQKAITAANKEGFKLSSLEKAANKASTAACILESAFLYL